MECLRPDLKPATAYNKYKCRCPRCRKYRAQKGRYELQKYPEKLREGSRRYRENNRVYVNESYAVRLRVLSISCPTMVSGRYSDAEDAVIVTWGGRQEDLARALGRNYKSLTTRIGLLRKAGLLK